MDTLLLFLATGWGTAIGLIFGLIGIVASFVIYLWTRRRKILAYSNTGERLLGLDGQLPSSVTVQFQGQNIPRLTRTIVIFWNSGEETIRGEDIVNDDPLKLVFEDNVLSCTILKVTRTVIKFSCEHDQENVSLKFSFLDAGDGAVIEILYTSKSQNFEFIGTIRGLPKGVSNWGRIIKWSRLFPPLPFANRNSGMIIPIASCITGVIGIIISLLPIKENFEEVNKAMGLITFIAGIIYLAMGLFIFWRSRKKYPRELHIEELE